MAASVLTLLLLASSASLALAADDNGTTTHLSFFMHDIQSGSDPTAVEVIKGPGSTPTAPALGMTFGDTTVMDNPVTETSSPSSAALGQMQGFYMLSSQSGAALMVCANLVLTSGDRNGSTVAVLGRDDTGQDVRELAVVGGTGAFRMATGYVLWQTTNTSGADTTVKLDVYLTTGGDGTSIDANAPVSPVDGGGGSSSGSGGSKASSAAQHSSRTLRRGGWAAVAVLVAAVVAGSSVW
ncbi:hypothetical protein BS78_02G003600 [Paspalum vaginatum]|nr:hypothetical protein BS78_02G003600 [Paspalum vaginatum]KAJ1287357.1 hypothetical protein BS78_02G003600 [Paspalum vaginatum]